MAKLFDGEGKEVEAFLPDEVSAKVTEAVTAKEAEFGVVKSALEGRITEKDQALAARANEFAQFRKLNDEQVAKLTESERLLYENGLALETEREKNATNEKNRIDGLVAAAIAGKAGDNEKLKTKMTEMWPLITLEATTPEAIEQKTNMILGAISTQEPDLVATVAGFGGTHLPPNVKLKEGETFADTPAGKAAAAELGLKLEPDTKK